MTMERKTKQEFSTNLVGHSAIDIKSHDSEFSNPFKALSKKYDQLLEEYMHTKGHLPFKTVHAEIYLDLFEHGETQLTVLADRFDITQQALGKKFKHMLKHGYITKVVNPADKRGFIIALTEKGTEVATVLTFGTGLVCGNILVEYEKSQKFPNALFKNLKTLERRFLKMKYI